MKKKAEGPSQVMDLFLHVAAELGARSDKDVADLAGGTPENVGNWRSGAVQEFKPGKLKSIKDGISARLASLRESAGLGSESAELAPLEIELGSGPADLQRQFRDRVAYDYLGHRFLYFDPQGALAWENIVRGGYDQDRWLAGVEACAQAWFDTRKDEAGRAKGPLAHALSSQRRGQRAGLELIGLGAGDGEKELRVMARALALARSSEHRLAWLSFMPVDVSISLLLSAVQGARKLARDASGDETTPRTLVQPICADFEEGRLSFLERLPSTRIPSAPSTRLVMILGNVLGNLRDEEQFVRQKLSLILRPQDLLWIEVGLRQEQPEHDPLFRLTRPEREETSAEAHRRLLLEGPYRRWESALGRMPSQLEMRIWVREDDDSSRVPGSLNFCHDLVIKEERRVCTMLYSRRYVLSELSAWFERLGYRVVRLSKVDDSKGRARVGHLLLERLPDRG